LIEIGDFIARDNAGRALDFVQAIRLRAAELGEAPQAYPIVARRAAGRLRLRPYGRYLIFYRIEEDCVAILRILHGARDWRALLIGE
jgi:toxin ParE1/3/4